MHKVFESRRFLLFTTKETTVSRLSGDAGIIVGSLFHRDGRSVRLADLSDDVSSALARYPGRELVRRFWGAWVGFVFDADGCLNIVRDPSAALPCYHITCDNLLVVASDLQLLLSTGIRPPEVDWDQLALHLRTPSFFSERTCLRGVKELPRGCCLRVTQEGDRWTPCWSPWDFASTGTLTSLQEASDELHDTVSKCSKALSRRHRTAVVRVSGGLDSSIVAASVADTVENLICATFVAPGSSGDERPYARALASRIGRQLVEIPLLADNFDLGTPVTGHLPRPLGNPNAQVSIKLAGRLAREVDATAILNGGGGDNVFFSSRSALALVDVLCERGVGRQFMSTLGNIARVTGAGYTKILTHAIRRLRQRNHPYAWRHDERHVGRRVTESENRHPWLADTQGHLPGKVAHVAAISAVHNFLEGSTLHAGGIPELSPLLAQPVIELCLRIPTWLWYSGGRDRAVARAAYADLLPSLITERAWKGSPEGLLSMILTDRRDELYELLSDGMLVRNGLISQSQVKEAMSASYPSNGPNAHWIVKMADVEAWVRHWSQRQPLCLDAFDSATVRRG